jgi:outer membrane beta-barrel protein
MESRLRLFLLMPLLAAGSTGCALFRHEAAPADTAPVTAPVATDVQGPTTAEVTEPVIEPKVERRVIKTPAIKSSDFELGVYVGILSIEDFGSHTVTGLRLDYHVTPGFFLEADYGRSQGGTSSAEQLGNFTLLTDKQRQYSRYSVSAGWNALPGEVFVGENRAYNSAIYFLVGAGNTNFANDDRFTLSGGFGYRILLNNWLATHLDVRDYLYDSDVLGKKKVVNNLEATLGLTFFF